MLTGEFTEEYENFVSKGMKRSPLPFCSHLYEIRLIASAGCER